MGHPEFWDALDALVAQAELVIDRPKGSRHPRYPQIVYPLNYGYLKSTASMDGGGIDVWIGTAPGKTVGGIVCTVDLLKRDAEIKVLLGCTQGEQRAIYAFHNNSVYMKGVLIPREMESTGDVGTENGDYFPNKD